MPRYYCDYCDAYLTHDSDHVRKQHNTGYRHKANVKAYYLQFTEEAQARLLAEIHGGPDAFMPPAGAIPPPHMMGGPPPPHMMGGPHQPGPFRGPPPMGGAPPPYFRGGPPPPHFDQRGPPPAHGMNRGPPGGHQGMPPTTGGHGPPPYHHRH